MGSTTLLLAILPSICICILQGTWLEGMGMGMVMVISG